jgi:ADP-ribose pyrophosphatase
MKSAKKAMSAKATPAKATQVAKSGSASPGAPAAKKSALATVAKAKVETKRAAAKVKPMIMSKTKPVAAKSTETAKPAEPGKVAKPGKNGKPEKPANRKKVAKSAKVAKATKVVKASGVGKASKAAKASKVRKTPRAALTNGSEDTAKLLDSTVVYEGPLFRVLHDHLIEPGGQESFRDVIRHNGSVVILAVDPAKKDSSKKKDKKDPWIVIERQYRHAAGQFLWELPAGKLDAGESPLDGAKRELAEETGYAAEKWEPLVEYFASPGFLGESMKVFLAEGLIAGEAHPEEDEKIDFRLVRLSELLEMVDKGKIIDGKTLTTVLLYARRLGLKRKK